MMTEQEKYYARKNQQAKDLDETIGLIIPVILIVCIGWFFIWAWPLTVFLLIVYLVGWLCTNIKNLIIETCNTAYNFIFRRNLIPKDTLELLDQFAILGILFFVIVLAISISLK